MTKKLTKRFLVLIITIWIAWSLVSLARQLRDAQARSAYLTTSIQEARSAIDDLSDYDSERMIRSMGYVYHGDMLFFDGG